MTEEDIQLMISLNTEDYINEHVQALMKEPVNPKFHYIKNIYYQYVFLENNAETHAGNFVPAIFLEKDNKYKLMSFDINDTLFISCLNLHNEFRPKRKKKDKGE